MKNELIEVLNENATNFKVKWIIHNFSDIIQKWQKGKSTTSTSKKFKVMIDNQATQWQLSLKKGNSEGKTGCFFLCISNISVTLMRT